MSESGKIIPFNPLDRLNLGVSVTGALLKTTPASVTGMPRFLGAGIYALYYNGRHKCYSRLAQLNRGGRFDWPIYVGKAVPAGARKGGIGLGENPSNILHARLREHAESIDLADNLKIGDFSCRFLVVEDIWIPLAESLLIAKFSPVWNTVVDGFGNHDPGKGRHEGLRPRWDTLHPGRAWAAKLRERDESTTSIAREVEAYLAILPPPEPT